ncbi:hypothetical protein [Nocardia lijiangensis]|uniref:hypothetical protein n=1 Tax=Nocardia lijiangensis TaxID=299618 RepID=UPI003D72D875
MPVYGEGDGDVTAPYSKQQPHDSARRERGSWLIGQVVAAADGQLDVGRKEVHDRAIG